MIEFTVYKNNKKVKIKVEMNVSVLKFVRSFKNGISYDEWVAFASSKNIKYESK